jgi:hypothetical protein
MTTVAGLRKASLRWQPHGHVMGGQRQASAENVAYHAYSSGMNNPPGRYDVTVRVAGDDGHPPDPAAFAVAASRAASSSNASVVSAHTAEEVICVVGVAAPDRPSAVAVALAVVAGALNAEDPVPSPSR